MNIISIKHLIAILVFSGSLVLAQNTKRLMPTYSKDLEFSYYSTQEGTSFYSKEFNIFYTQRAEQRCLLSEKDIRDKLNSLDFWVNLESAIPGAKEKWLNLDVTLGVDDFADLYPSRSSYFLEHFPDQRKFLVSIDCRLLKTTLFLSKVAHEMIHAFMDTYQLPIWFEEMVAQNVESDFNLDYLKNAKIYLSKRNYLPNPLKTEKPFSGSDRYTANLLLSEYLRQAFFKSNFWRDIFLSKSKDISFEGYSNTELFTYIRKLSKTAPAWIPKVLDDKIILKHFYLALVINQQDQDNKNIFKLDGWQGFQEKPLDVIDSKIDLESGSAIRLSFRLAKNILTKNSIPNGHQWDAFLVESSYNEYKILDMKTIDPVTFSQAPGKTYEVLLINWGNTLSLSQN
jgi:hypothetical protein